jgi:phosphoenolpyruvate carboxykinase (ATP)
MWNKLVYDRGGLPLHAGCKIIPTDAATRSASPSASRGPGKTTTTFTQPERLAARSGRLRRLDGRRPLLRDRERLLREDVRPQPEDEPTIYGAVTQPDSYLENVSQHGDDVDFYDESYTQNGRANVPVRRDRVAAEREIDGADFLLV